MTAIRFIAVFALAAAPLAAQGQDISRAFELERRGEYGAAADAYRAVLRATPAEAAALLGLERVLVPLNRPSDLLPEVRAALAANPANPVVYGVALRAWAAADQPDSVRAVAERWADLAPADETPYREWGAAALSRHDRRARSRRTSVVAHSSGGPKRLPPSWLGSRRSRGGTPTRFANGWRQFAVSPAIGSAPRPASRRRRHRHARSCSAGSGRWTIWSHAGWRRSCGCDGATRAAGSTPSSRRCPTIGAWRPRRCSGSSISCAFSSRQRAGWPSPVDWRSWPTGRSAPSGHACVWKRHAPTPRQATARPHDACCRAWPTIAPLQAPLPPAPPRRSFRC